jgi:RHS repeat-associated protein
VKVAKKVSAPEVQDETDYLSGFQYKNGELQFFPTAEGYVNVSDGGKFNYVYNYTDHLGNIRVSYTFDGRENELKILEENHYYPFGLKHSNYNVDKVDFEKDETGFFVILKTVERSDYQYKYNGKEFQDELGLNVYDYGARFYDPAIGRFWQTDPIAESSRRFSTYSYAVDNPVFFIDRDGMFADIPDQTGEPKKNPFESSPPKEGGRLEKSVDKFVPSDKTLNLVSEGKKLLSEVFGYDLSGEVGYSVGVTGTLGPVKVEGEVSVGSASLSTNENSLIEGKVEGPSAKLGGKLGTASGEVGFTSGSATAAVDKKMNVTTSTEGGTGTKKGSLGGDTKLSVSNSFTLGLTVKIPTPEGVSAKVGGSVNLYKAAAAGAAYFQAGTSYISDVASNIMSW